MSAYRENRRADKVPRLNAITANEALEGTDLRRTQQYERAMEEIADDLKQQHQQGQKKSFAALLKKK